jgi:signal transduction histidine kinase
VSIRDIGHSLQVDISDQGVGIPVEEHLKIWRRFYQVDGSATRAFNGLGLGLAIVRQVIEKHEGHVSVSSEPGKGSVFTFTLPKIEVTGLDAVGQYAASH